MAPPRKTFTRGSRITSALPTTRELADSFAGMAFRYGSWCIAIIPVDREHPGRDGWIGEQQPDTLGKPGFTVLPYSELVPQFEAGLPLGNRQWASVIRCELGNDLIRLPLTKENSARGKIAELMGEFSTRECEIFSL